MMKKISIIFLVVFALSLVSAQQTEVSYYHGLTCPHCKVVEESGILDKVGQIDNVNLNKYEVWFNMSNQPEFEKMLNAFSIPENQRGVPFAVVNCSGKYTYINGDQPIINNLENYASTCEFPEMNFDPNKYQPGSSSKNSIWIIWTLIFVIIAFFSWLAFKKK